MTQGSGMLAMFASPSPDGARLVELVERIARPYGLEVAIVDQPDVDVFTRAVLTCTVVVLDGSLDNEALFAAAIPFRDYDHVLVVGRTYLPINFIALRKGGGGPYPARDAPFPGAAWFAQETKQRRTDLPDSVQRPKPNHAPLRASPRPAAGRSGYSEE